MSLPIQNILTNRIEELKPNNDSERLSIARELVQEIILLGLTRIGFGNVAAFHGGTALRILYKLNRYSEDLDFCLIKPDKSFSLNSALSPILEELIIWGLQTEITKKEKFSGNVQKLFIKETSIGAILSIDTNIHRMQKITIKIEIDTNPPEGAIIESKLVEFPNDYYVTCHNITSLWAGKLHAVIRRPYIKGRDWFDLLFYFSKKILPNFDLLRNSLIQSEPDVEIPLTLDINWLNNTLKERIESVDFNKVKTDVMPFVFKKEDTDLWSKQYFLDKLSLYCEHFYNNHA